MRRLWGEIKSHRRAAYTFLALWFLVWVATIATWTYDERGYTAGMRGWAFVLYLLLPLGAGITVGTWRGNGLLAGPLVSITNVALLIIWGGVLGLLGKTAPEAGGFAQGLPGFLGFTVFSLVLGLLLGFAGAWLGRMLAPESTAGRARR